MVCTSSRHCRCICMSTTFCLSAALTHVSLARSAHCIADTGLKDAMGVSADANGFLRTFPLQSLLAAQSPRDVTSALPAIFSHFQQKLKLSPVRLFLLDYCVWLA